MLRRGGDCHRPILGRLRRRTGATRGGIGGREGWQRATLGIDGLGLANALAELAVIAAALIAGATVTASGAVEVGTVLIGALDGHAIAAALELTDEAVRDGVGAEQAGRRKQEDRQSEKMCSEKHFLIIEKGTGRTEEGCAAATAVRESTATARTKPRRRTPTTSRASHSPTAPTDLHDGAAKATRHRLAAGPRRCAPGIGN